MILAQSASMKNLPLVMAAMAALGLAVLLSIIDFVPWARAEQTREVIGLVVLFVLLLCYAGYIKSFRRK